MDREQVLAGVRNLVHTCAEVKRGENVLILNDQSDVVEARRQARVDPDLPLLIADAVREAGASCYELWGESGDGAPLPHVLLGAVAAADKVISHYRLDEGALVDYLGDDTSVVYIYSRFRTLQEMGSEHARYHWSMARAIYDRFENEILREGKTWRITSAAGTDLSGIIGPRFIEPITPLSRPFTSTAHNPVTSVGAEGRIVVRYGPRLERVPTDPPPIVLGGLERIPIAYPPTLVVEGNTVVGVEGPFEAKGWVELFKNILEERLRQRGPDANAIHSWHTGLNPKAECIPGLVGNASLDSMHFHLGPMYEPISAKVGENTLEVDGEKVIDQGKFAWIEDQKLQEAARSYGLTEWW